VKPARLLEEAEHARRRSHSPYSRFAVGAALLLEDGTLVHGCNIENGSFGLTVCAERTAAWKAVTDGRRDFVAIAVTAGPGEFAPPCGACRQVLHEFAPAMWVIWRDRRGRIVRKRLDQILPHAFDLAPRRRRSR
jgi:cytidine deaminase